MITTTLSIIIPVYNVENYLKECIESVLKQDIEDYEIILVDDGSTDKSGTICDEYAENYQQIKAFHHRNSGLGWARNFGISKATGKYILYLDSDDYYKEKSLGKLLAIAERDNLDILFFGAFLVCEDGLDHYNVYDRRKTVFDVVKSGIDGLREDIANQEYITSVCLRLFRREFLLQNKFRFNEKFIHEDEDYAFLSYLLADRTEIVQDRVYARRYRRGSIITSRKYDQMLNGYGYAARKLIDYAQRDDVSLDARKLLRRKAGEYLLIICKFYASLSREERKKMKEMTNELFNSFRHVSKYFDMKSRLCTEHLKLSIFLIRLKRALKAVVDRE